MVVLGRLLPDSGKVHQNQEVYYTRDNICAIKACHYKDPPKIIVEVKYGKEDKNKTGMSEIL